MALTYKDIDMSKVSKGMKQYLDIKMKYMESILFFRLGDFYEMFFDDAVLVSKELELTLTSKDCSLSERAPMCGIPHHACDTYIKRLIDNGHSVAICEQLEDPATAKDIVKRDVVKIITPGTLTDSQMISTSENNWLACVYLEASSCSMCFADISTGEAHLYRSSEKDLQSFIINKLSRYSPSEVLCQKKFSKLKEAYTFITEKLHASVKSLDDSDFDYRIHKNNVFNQFSNDSFTNLGLDDSDVEAKVSAALFLYIEKTQCASVARFFSIVRHVDDSIMTIGYTARNNLELTRTIRSNSSKGTLLWVLDKTKTAMGKRMLVTFIGQPLMKPAAIIARLDAVEDLVSDIARLGMLREKLSGVYDLERLMTKVLYKTVSPQDLKSLSSTAELLPGIKSLLSQCKSSLIVSLNDEISDLGDIANLINNSISDNLPTTMKDGGYIKDGFNDELDELRSIAENGSALIDKIIADEKEKTGIKSLKKGYNRVFGYYIEVTKSFYGLVPTDRYIRKQTLANCERFITSELKEAEDTIINATDKIIGLEAEIFEEIREYVSNALGAVQRTAYAIANIDALASLAIVALNNNYVKPDIAIDGIIDIRNGRHPVVELMLENEIFVPNNAYLDLTDNRMIILTGPNMSGKSTYMRQIALIVIMAQMGSFVPADYAKISVVDQIFTRVGASDDLSAGQSTFMVEMSEVADIVKHATKNSLVILDEVGRGTSTFDGISIARSVAEHIANQRKIGCKTLFATHYHELIELESECEGVKNFSVAVRRGSDGIRFLRKIVRGGVDQSYGLEVAKLAGLPESILKRAKQILCELEAKATQSQAKPNDDDGEVTFSFINEMNAIDMLRKTNIDELSDSELRELVNDVMKYI